METARKFSRSAEKVLQLIATPKTIATRLQSLVNELESEGGEKLPLGIGIAGMLDRSGNVVVNSPNLGWRDEPFADLVKDALQREVSLENDLSVIAWGEYRFGAAREFENAVVVFIGTGIGGGAVLNGELYRGASNSALEIGHVRVVPEGRTCGCGGTGCVEAYAGGYHLAEMAKENPSEALLKIAGGDRDAIHAGHIDQAAREGDEQSTQLIVQAAAFVAGVLGDVTVLLNPDCLVLGGTVWHGCEHLRELIVHLYASLPPAPARQEVKMVQAELGDGAGIVGAADLAQASRSK